MKITIAIDSFKGSLTSLQAGEAAAEGIKRVWPEAETRIRPLADGGEGTVEALALGMGGTVHTVKVTGPAGKLVDAQYGILEDGKTAVMEMAAAAGITQVAGAEKNPLYTTTYGVGEMICDAVKKGCRSFIMGIGGSATNDGGIGMLQALGYGILGPDGEQVARGAQGLRQIERITDGNVLPELAECSFRIACDVTNPLCGDQGCSVIFGPQKGADPEMIRDMDGWLQRYSEKAAELKPDADPLKPGTGAAGGIGFAFLTFTNAVLESGVTIVLEETQLARFVEDADWVVTGEGRLDGQTVMGKAPIGVARIAKQAGKRVIAFSGCVTPDAVACNEAGIDAFFPILRTVVSLEKAMDTKNAYRNMADTAEQVFRLINTCG